MHYLLNPLLRAMRRLHDSELRLTIIGGYVISAVPLEELGRNQLGLWGAEEGI